MIKLPAKCGVCGKELTVEVADDFLETFPESNLTQIAACNPCWEKLGDDERRNHLRDSGEMPDL